METKTYSISGKVEKFPGKGGWFFIKASEEISKSLKSKVNWGLVPIRVTLGKTSWDTSLLPMGDGTHFVALKAVVRKKEKVSLGDKVSLKFILR